MSKIPSCFVGYPSKPESLSETIQEAIKKIAPGGVVNITDWTSTKVGGKFIMDEICDAIKKNDIFFSDLTTLNLNVLFELGFAIARDKRIWPIRDPKREGEKNFERLRIFTTVGCTPYNNSDEIVAAFYKGTPFSDLENTIYKSVIEPNIKRRKKPTLLYLKSAYETEASIKLSARINKSIIPTIIDDPKEVTTQTLSWYAKQVCRAYAVIVHFLGSEYMEWKFHKAKNSFVAGLAYGFGRDLVMLAHETYESPIDYREILKNYGTAVDCERIADDWLKGIDEGYKKKVEAELEYKREYRAYSELENITIGDPIAENEAEALADYFIPTPPYQTALRSKHSIIIGSRGSGKTAILYKLEDDLRGARDKLVCIIRPVSYELEGIKYMSEKAIPKAERGYLLESFWKFLIYTELAKTEYEIIEKKPPYALDPAENEFFSLVRENSSIILNDFSLRLEAVIKGLIEWEPEDTALAQRAKMSELLHEKVLEKLRSLFGKVFGKKEVVSIIIDNLDKIWDPNEKSASIHDFLLALLYVTQDISRDFERADHWREPVNLSIVVFLASDIFNKITSGVREKYKLSPTRIIWDDRNTLLRVIEQRFFESSSELVNPSDVWDRYFCVSVKGHPTSEYIFDRILPRPRDLILLSQAAINIAVSRGHVKVEADDILRAERVYSQFALDTLSSETTKEIEELIYEFVSAPEIITREDIMRAAERAGSPLENLAGIIDTLCELEFLGLEVDDNRFEFLHNESDNKVFFRMAQKMKENSGEKNERYRINPAFHAYLEIKGN